MTKKEVKWQLGNMEIKETQKYKYLGDIITPDGKNSENLQSKANKLQSITLNY